MDDGATDKSTPSHATEREWDDVRSAEEIRNLLVRYGLYLDAKDYEGYVSLFTDDGVLEAPLGTAHGRDDIRAMLDNVLGPIDPGFHLNANPLIEVAGNDARSTSRFCYVQPVTNGLPELRLVGHYEDQLRREDGHWRFALRTITIDAGRPPYRD
jgi:ketosteroid isomerase-like protein